MDTRRLPDLRNTPPNTMCPAWRMVSWSRPPLPKGGSSAFIPRMRCRSTACSTCSRTSIGPSLPHRTRSIPTRLPSGSPFRPLYDDKILFNGQPVALVVAEEFEIARFAASLIRVEYERKPHVTDFDAQRERGAISKRDPANSVARGNPAPAFERAAVRIEAEYRMPVEHHNPME